MKTKHPLISRYGSLNIGVLMALLPVLKAHSNVPVVEHVVLLGSAADAEGNSYLYEPFSFEGPGAGSLRVQQVYAASEFLASSAPDGGWIYGLELRADGSPLVNNGTHSADIRSLQITMSVTTRGPDELSPVFAENIGLNVTTVYLGAKYLQVVGDHPGPTAWIGGILFDTPYFYDPRQGNLLMDVINIGPPTFVALDAVNVEGDGVSRVYQDFSSQTPISGTTDTKGLATAFNIMLVPEPSTWVLLGMGGVILAWRCWNSNSRRKLDHVAH